MSQALEQDTYADAVDKAIADYRARLPELQRLARELFGDEVDGYVDVPCEGDAP